jgi:Concanavalin A-like lectin/glucanases superfamily/Bacterial Ig domain
MGCDQQNLKTSELVGWYWGMLKIPLLFSLGQQLRRALFRWLRKVKFFLAFCTVLFTHELTTGYVAAQLQNGLVGHWSFDDGSGTTASDSSGNGNTATLINGPSWSTAGQIAGALSFDGFDDYVAFASQAQSTISISVWVYAQATPGNVFPRIIDMPGYVLFLAEPSNPSSNPASLGFRSRRSDQDGEWDTPANSLAYNSWNHVAIVYDSSSTSNNADLYINGVKQTISKINSPQGTQTANEGAGIIGNRIPLNRGWDGLIDELRVYNRALSASEIVSLYDQGNSGPFNFSLANSMSLSANQGSSATNTITASLVSGSPEPVSLSASGLASGASASFSQKTCSPFCSSLLTIATAASTPTGTYTITVAGTGGGVTRTTSFTLTVNSLTGSPPSSPPSGNSVSTNIANGAVLSGSSVVWMATPSGSPVRVEFFIDGVLLWTENVSPYQFNGDSLGTLNTNTLSNGSHQLKVRAIYSDNSTAEQTITVTISNGTTPAPVAPSAQLTLTWQDNSNNEDDFAIERKTGTNGAYSQIASVGANVTSYLDNSVTRGVNYCYRVQAANNAGASAYTNEACATVQ